MDFSHLSDTVAELPESNSRQFVRWFLGIAVLALAIVVSINVYVDPLQATDSKRFAKFKIDDRATKASLLYKMKSVDYVMLGSSRIQRYDPEVVFKLSGKRGFNGGVVAGSNTDAADAVEWLAARAKATDEPMPHIVLGFSVESFAAPDSGRRPIPFPKVSSYKGHKESLLDRAKRYKVFFQYKTTKESIRAMVQHESSVRDLAQADGKFEVPRFRQDGYLSAGPYYLGGDGSGEIITLDIAGQYRGFYSKYGSNAGSIGLNDHEVDSFERILRIANKAGDTPTIMVLPMRPDFANELRSLNRETYAKRIESMVDEYRTKYKFHMYEFEGTATSGAGDFGYFDGVHPKPDVAARIMKKLVNKDPFFN